MFRLAILGALLVAATAAVVAQRRDVFVTSRDDAAIQYSKGDTADAVTALNRRLEQGSASLEFDQTTGYLRAVLKALNVPIESQMLVFSQTSFQAPLINMHNPRGCGTGSQAGRAVLLDRSEAVAGAATEA
jgi:hypothetical protein